MNLPDPPILVITDRTQSAEPIEVRVEALFRGGCRWLSLREKDLAPPDRKALLSRLTAIGARYGATVGVHDDLSAARDCAAALHLPAGADPAEARRRLGPRNLIGQSCHGSADISRATGADYVTLSPVFESVGKPGYGPLIGADGIRGAVTASSAPVLALGGVSISTLSGLKGTGVAGIAVMGDAMRTPAPETWFAQLAVAWMRITV